MPAASGLSPLLELYQTDLGEVDGKICAIHRGCPPVATIADADLGAHLWTGLSDPPPKVTAQIVPELELPGEYQLTYLEPAREFQTNTQAAIRHSRPFVQEAAQLSVPIVFSAKGARRMAERQLYQVWLERAGFQFALGPKWLSLVPGSPVWLPVGGGLQRVRIRALDMGMPGELRVSATLDGDWVLVQSALGGPSLDYRLKTNSMYLPGMGV